MKTPEKSEVEKAKELLQKAEEAKMALCINELNEVLNKHGYSLATSQVQVVLNKKP
jgi:hypothetical protein